MKRRKAQIRAEVENEKERKEKERRYLPADVSILTSDQKTDKRSIVKKTLFWLPEAKVACWGRCLAQDQTYLNSRHRSYRD